MAKSIAVRLAGESSSFSYARLERDKLYGRKERQVVDADGRRCSSAWLTADGAALVPSGGLAMLYVDEDFATVERAQLEAVDDQGAPVPVLPATVGVEQDLEGPLPAARVLDHAIHTVYTLAAESVGPALAAALAQGQVFSAPFNARDDYQRQTMFLIANDQGTFALVGSAPGFIPVRRDAAPPAAAGETDELSDDLDFSMM
jgi:hypothetical protein